MPDYEQKYEELLRATANMRKLQKKYFQNKIGSDLTNAKKAESQVDKIINADLAKAIQLQQTLKF